MKQWNDWELTPAERNHAVSQILDAGLPPRHDLLTELRMVREALDLRMLFFGVEDSLFLALVAAVLVYVPLAAVTVQQLDMTPLLFLTSPMLYAFLTILTAWKEDSCGVLGWRQSCRVSLRAASALRMLLFGGASVLLVVPANAALWMLTDTRVPLGWMLGVSLSSLFLYGALSLSCQFLGAWKGCLLAPGVWVMVGILLMTLPGAGAWLLQVPTAVFFVLAGGGLAVYLLELRRFCLMPGKGVLHHAFY